MNAPHNGIETSQEAAESIGDLLQGIRKAIYELLREFPCGLTCDEVEQRINLKHQTASARLNEMVEMGHATFRVNQETNKPFTRKTRSGRNARIYFFVA